MYPLWRSLSTSASRAMSRSARPKLPLYFLVSPEHSFSQSIYAHFSDNWFLGNCNFADNLLEPPYFSWSPQSSFGHSATSLHVLKKKPSAAFESCIHQSPISIYSFTLEYFICYEKSAVVSHLCLDCQTLIPFYLNPLLYNPSA